MLVEVEDDEASWVPEASKSAGSVELLGEENEEPDNSEGVQFLRVPVRRFVGFACFRFIPRCFPSTSPVLGDETGRAEPRRDGADGGR